MSCLWDMYRMGFMVDVSQEGRVSCRRFVQVLDVEWRVVRQPHLLDPYCCSTFLKDESVQVDTRGCVRHTLARSVDPSCSASPRCRMPTLFIRSSYVIGTSSQRRGEIRPSCRETRGADTTATCISSDRTPSLKSRPRAAT